ncbi:pold2, partial [Symbiodinium sp. CCMP2456]
LAIASGFRIGNARTRKAELLLLRDFLLGQLGAEEDIATAQRIGRLLIAGGLHAEDAELPSCLGRPKRPRVPSEKVQRSFAAAAADEADLFLAPLSCQLKLCILSGEGDCGVSRRLPQPALPFAIFPRSRRSGNLELWTNPFCRAEGELQVVGHAGQPLHLALRNASEPTTALKSLLDCWRRQYLAPKWPEFLLDRDCSWIPSSSHKRPRLVEFSSSRATASRPPGSGSASLSLGALLRWQLFASPTSRSNRPSCSSTRRTSPSRSSASKSPRPRPCAAQHAATFTWSEPGTSILQAGTDRRSWIDRTTKSA